MWLRQLCKSKEAVSEGAKGAGQVGSEEQIDFWAINQPIVTWLLRNMDVKVACDPERSDYKPLGGSSVPEPAVIWAWSVTDGSTIYGFGLKHSVRKASKDLAMDMAEDLLGDALDRTMFYAMELTDLQRIGLQPPEWRRDAGWGQALRQLSRRILERESTFQKIAEHLLDPKREQWVPSHRRAA